MNEEMKQFAEIILNSLQAMEQRLNTRMDTMIEEINEQFDNIEVKINDLMNSTVKTAIKVSNINEKIQQHESDLGTLALSHLRLLK